ncbi:MAG: tRNA guanosine(34) transglycosylase Tgt [Bacteroidales bacterium]|nr:tRNA guanosine(34) transglycosylase Tgt [Bacteroidales bacterium]
MNFTVLKNDSRTSARTGVLKTAHGEVRTPIFMPVATVGSVKGVYHRDLKQDIGAEIILGNTYHLYLRPGLEILRAAGGLHKFEGWDRPMLTDSGGFQVFSLTGIRKLTAQGCTFQSHIDGSRHTFTPENNVHTQRVIGADIMMALDECCPGDADYKYARESLILTQGWLERYAAEFAASEPLYGYEQTFFPIIQGCVYPDLRIQAAEHALRYADTGIAIGGLAVGEPTEKMYEMLELLDPVIPRDKARYLMGVGTPSNIIEAISRGVDMLDCVMPTRNGRNAMLFTWNGVMNLRNAKWQSDFSELDPQGTSFVDHAYSKAYLRHLFVAGEMFAAMIASEHNLAFYLDLVRTCRRHIEEGDFAEWKQAVLPKLSQRL